MEVNKNETKKSFKQLLAGYIGNYIGDLPKTRKEIIAKLPTILKQLGLALGNTVLGQLFGSAALAYSAIPLGTAYLCSVKKYVGFVYIGLAISAATEKTGLGVPLFLIYTALLLARVIVHRLFSREDDFELFGEGVGYRLIEGISAAIMISFYRLASFGFLYYDLIGGFFEIVTVPICIMLYDYAFNEKYRQSIRREAGITALFCALLIALKGVYVFGFAVCLPVTAIITFYVSKTAGVLRGGIYGLICGFVCSPVLSPVFAIMGMVSGALWRVGTAAALTVSGVVGIICGVYVDGWNSLPAFAPEFMFACILFFPFVQFGLLPKNRVINKSLSLDDEAEITAMLAEKRQKDTEKRFNELSEAFAGLSKVFYTLSDRTTRPRLIDAGEICDSVCDHYCPRCFFKAQCWEREYSATSSVFSKISKTLCEKGYVDLSAVEGYMKERCRHMEVMLDRINDRHARLLEALIKQNKTEIFAMDYESVAHLLSEAVKTNCEEFLPRDAIRKKLAEAMKYMKFPARNVCVYGKRRLTVVANGIDMVSMKLPADEIKRCFENICEMPMGQPSFEVEGDYVTMTIESEKRIGIECAASSETKENERLCGDLVCMFENDNGYFYSLISDGMGSGREAALTSRLCGVFLKKMLVAGNGKPVALEMLNNFIRSKNTECFSTVDLLEIDMLTGKASFVKSGAVASFIMRGDKIFRIASNTMPIGITKEINAEEVKFDLAIGDVIVMVSDGVGQSTEDTVRVSNLLTYSWEDDLQKMADKIKESAKESSGRSDDISVGVIKITAA
ncbi:MAG: SpoIIE family protein phosphatase [Clostridia bacterium]|nr:SpoIIE family protein phosphatase [Clostridia bacterium]